MAPDHGLPNFIRRFGAFAGEVVDLRAVRRRPSSRRTARKDKRAANTLIGIVGQLRQTLEFSDRRGPDRVEALNNFVSFRLNFMWHRRSKKVCADTLINRVFATPIDHKGRCFGANALQYIAKCFG